MTRAREVKAGQVWDIAHTRKGNFTVGFDADHSLDAPDEWVSGIILEGRAKYISFENRLAGAGETGEPITMRASMVTLLKRRPDLEAA